MYTDLKKMGSEKGIRAYQCKSVANEKMILHFNMSFCFLNFNISFPMKTKLNEIFFCKKTKSWWFIS